MRVQTKAIHLLLALTLVCQIAFPSQAYSENSNDDPTIALSQDQKTFDVQNPEAATQAANWAAQHEALTGDILSMTAELFEYSEGLLERVGPARYSEMVNKGEVVVPRQGFGKAEMNTVDGIEFVRVVHDQSRVSYLVMKKKKDAADIYGVDPNSKHLRQLIARQNIEAGNWTGRDVILVWLDDGGEVAKLDGIKKGRTLSAKWWSDYWFSKWKVPAETDFTMGLFAGTFMQGSLGAVAAAITPHIIHYFHPSIPLAPMMWTPAILSAGFGLGVGTFVSTYKNWTNSGPSPIRRALKTSTVSAAFAYSLIVLTQHGLSSVSFMTAAGLAMNVSILANVAMNNYAKDAWYRVTRVRTKLRENAKEFSFNIGGKTINTGWNQSSFENQMIYLIPWTLNILALMGLSLSLAVPFSEKAHLHIPILQLLSVPLAKILSIKYLDYLEAEKRKDPDLQAKADEIKSINDGFKKEWNDFWEMDVKDAPRALYKATKGVCQNILNFLAGSQKEVQN